MKKYSILFVLFLQCLKLIGQISTAHPQITKPLPSVSTLMNFVDVPVNLHTGTPDINFPLYNLPTHTSNISCNVSLGYHPSGVSFLERASDVGTGWNLIGGGVISRNVIEEPDETYNTSTSSPNYIVNQFNDVYNYNFNGISGRFQIVRNIQNNTFTIEKLDKSNVKIDFDINPVNFKVNSFTIYDDKGYKYVFDQIDFSYGFFYLHTAQNSINPALMGYNSAHHLSKVYDNNGKELMSCSYTSYQYQSPVAFNQLYINSAMKLASISSVGYGKVEFNYSFTDTSDATFYSDPIQLDNILIKDVNQNLLKKYSFTYSFSNILPEKRRRYLDKITEHNSTLTESKDYNILYKGDYVNPNNCDDYEFGTDIYGYLNLKPKYSIQGQDNYWDDPVDLVTREVCEIGVIKSMTMPTGGRVEYEFESNTLTNTTDPNDYNLVNSHAEYGINSDNYDPPFVYASTSFNTTTSTSWQFTVSGTTPKKLFFKTESTPYTSPTSDPVDTPLHPTYRLVGPNGFDYYFDITMPEIYPDNFACLGKKIVLEPGTYTMYINKLVGTGTSGTITVSEMKLKNSLKGWRYECGVRIKKISNFESSNSTTPAKETNYDYQFFNDSNLSSGEMYDGSYVFENGFEKFANAQINYRNVKVYETGDIGHTKYYFKSFTENSGNSFRMAYKEGLLEKMEIYDNSNNNYRILARETNTFVLEEIGIDPIIYNFLDTNITKTAWAKLTQKVSESFFYDSGNNQKIVQSTETFTYNTTNRLLDEQTVSNSLGEILKTKYYYHTGNSTLSKNRISELEKVEKYRDAVLLSTTRINYINTFTGNVSYLPYTISNSKEAASQETRLRYVAFDDYSNPLQVQQENGLITSYIWGYNKTLPIAKIENVAYASIPSATITDLQTKSNAINGEANLITALNALRTAFPSAMITTFTHIPLVGLSTVTDPKGEKISYVYDAFNRLKEVRDKDNNILSENEYFYRGTNNSVQNYVKNKTYKIATTTSIGSPSITEASQVKTYYDGLGRTIQQAVNAQSNSGKDIITHFEYDSFGRQIKNYLPFASTQTSMDYIDSVTLKSNIVNQYQTKYGDTNPFSEELLENSPLNRVLEHAGSGNDWSLTNPTKHTIRFNYQTNTTLDDFVVKLFKATTSWDSSKGFFDCSLTSNGSTNYPVDQLYVIITKNENWKSTDLKNNTTEEYKDKEGRIILKRTFDNSVAHDTYYVYDQFGNLTYVIPPKADTAITQSVLNDLCYQYKYDGRNRLVEKKLPGKQWEFIVYDKLDRVVATGPVFSPFSNLIAPSNVGWLITKYDGLSRPIITAWMQSSAVTSAGRKTLQDTQNSSTTLSETKSVSDATVNGVTFRYTNLAWPTSGYHVLTISYYDNYTSNLTFTPTIAYTPIFSQTLFNNSTGSEPKGMPTMSWVRTCETSTSYNSYKSYTLYDLKGRVIRSFNNNYLGGYTQIDNQIESITGRVNYSETRHKRLLTDTEIYVKDAFIYNSQDRVLTHTHQIGATGIPQLLAENTYDDLGQLTSKKVGNTSSSPYQKVDYSYNIRGWLTGINNVDNLTDSPRNDLFAFKLNYNTVVNETNYTGVPLYNGNIAETYWVTSTDNVKRKYGYLYDNLNRLKNAIYQKPNNAVKVTNSYNESMSYDKNGNIITLQRNGDLDMETATITIDNLSYTYDSSKQNELRKVFDAAKHPAGFKDDSVDGVTDPVEDYTYDLNGNMLTDQNKGITATTYNHLNLPTKITFGTTGTIEYLYNASGIKVKKIFTSGSTLINTDYLEGFQYEKGGTGNVALVFFPHAEGYVNNTVVNGNNVYDYVYNYKDHLGNIRVSYAWNNATSSLKILEENHYFPFGLKHTKYNSNSYQFVPSPQGGYNSGIVGRTDNSRKVYNYKYNGKELQEELGLNMYDYGARNFDPALGRWMNIDPLAEKYDNSSPFCYAASNPIFFIDPNGMRVDVTKLVNSKNEEDGWLLIELMISLSEMSGGMTIGKTVDEKGKHTLTGSGKGDGSHVSSYISYLLNTDKQFTVEGNEGGGSRGEGYGTVKLDPAELNGMQKGLEKAGYSKNIFSIGMAFLHETMHTEYGADFWQKEKSVGQKQAKGINGKGGFFVDGLGGEPGQVESRLNIYRKELGLPTLRRYTVYYYDQGYGTIFLTVDGKPVNVNYQYNNNYGLKR